MPTRMAVQSKTTSGLLASLYINDAQLDGVRVSSDTPEHRRQQIELGIERLLRDAALQRQFCHVEC